MQGAWVQSLVGELRSHMPQGAAKKIKKKKKQLEETTETSTAWWFVKEIMLRQ